MLWEISSGFLHLLPGIRRYYYAMGVAHKLHNPFFSKTLYQVLMKSGTPQPIGQPAHRIFH